MADNGRKWERITNGLQEWTSRIQIFLLLNGGVLVTRTPDRAWPRVADVPVFTDPKTTHFIPDTQQKLLLYSLIESSQVRALNQAIE